MDESRVDLFAGPGLARQHHCHVGGRHTARQRKQLQTDRVDGERLGQAALGAVGRGPALTSCPRLHHVWLREARHLLRAMRWQEQTPCHSSGAVGNVTESEGYAFDAVARPARAGLERQISVVASAAIALDAELAQLLDQRRAA